MVDYVWLIPLFPLIGVLVNGLLGSRLSKRLVASIGSLAVGASFVVAVLIFVEMLGLPLEGEGRRRIVPLVSWIAVGDLDVSMRIWLDELSIVMTLVVTGVSTVIHVYSAGYMLTQASSDGKHRDEPVPDERRHFARYFTWLNLFVLMMLLLVLGDSFLTLFVGWEGVGLCSYLLIGYWFQKDSAANAGKKAFLVNRVGDVGFMLGSLLIFATFGSLAFDDVFPAAAGILPATATAISLLLLLGATGKSAQIPLYVWLPDAMEGPTPVSALIHAATMVTAGIYMIARCHSLFLRSDVALTWVMVVGGLTAFFAATMALLERDLKRILAYSTISQLGYMFLAVGAGAFAAGIFHLTTHAFFKALLFLAAGSVMHALVGELDIFKMGGLRKLMPITFATFLVGALALAGVPPLSGFVSKDEILVQLFEAGPLWLWLLGVVTAGLTAFYAFRMVFLVFGGPSRLDKRIRAHAHESPGILTMPLVVLAVLAALGGGLGLPFGLPNAIDRFLEPVFEAPLTVPEGVVEATHSLGTEVALMAASVLAAGLGIYLAYTLYIARPRTAARWTEGARWLYDLVVNKYYVDRGYMEAVVRPVRMLGRFLAQTVEPLGIDGAVNGLARLVGLAGQGLSRLQTGVLRTYALAMLLGVVAVLAYFVLGGLLGLL
jgi:NADH-quinone oxidoreductase subunit L